jgi:DNA polymerase-3 subunit alpha
LFQISHSNSIIIKKTKASSIEDLAQILALNRPGAMEYIEKFISFSRTNEKDKIEGILNHSKLRPIIEKTRGIILFQEQIMKIAMEGANFTALESEILRKIISKKDMPKMMALKDRIIREGTRALGSEQAGMDLFHFIENFQGYGFNKSHAIAYAFNTYYMAYFKNYAPRFYYNACFKFLKSDFVKNLLINELVYKG